MSIKGFHPGLLKFCTMHFLNLGLLYVANGASLHLDLISMLLFLFPVLDL